MAGRNKRNTPALILGDDKNKQIVAAKNLKPSATLEEIGEAVGLSPSAVCQRLKYIREALRNTDEVTIGNDQIRALVPLAVAVYAEALGNSDKDAARDILRTHGVLVDKRKYELDFTDPAVVRELFSKIPAGVLDQLDDESGEDS